MNSAVVDVLLQAREALLPAGVINGAGFVVGLAGIAIVVAWVASLFR